MKLNYIELFKYKRMALNNITLIRITPETKVQTILGTNGSGKSSLLSEMTPLPSSKDNFHKDGYKKISYTHNGKEYFLSSVFHPAQRHSFKIGQDGEELNPGGTVTVQKELVFQHFGIKQHHHDLITGVEKFTTMSPIRRREWLTELCDENYDYALLVYSRAREKQRDISGALKLAKKRLVSEQTKLIHEEDIKRLKDQISALALDIDKIYQIRNDNPKTVQDVLDDKQSIENLIQSYSKEAFKILAVIGKKANFISSEYDECITIKREEIAQIQTKITISNQEYQDLSEYMAQFKTEGGSDGSDLDENMRRHLERRKTLSSAIKTQVPILDANTAIFALESIYEDLMSILVNLPINEEDYYTQSKIDSYKQSINSDKEKLFDYENRINRLAHEKEHYDALENSDSVDCPKCSHKWVVGYSKKKHDELKNIIIKGTEAIQALKKRIEENNQKLQEQEDYFDNFSKVFNSFRSAPVLKPLWEELINSDILKKSPFNAIRMIELYKSDVSRTVEIETINKDVERLGHLIEIRNKANSEDSIKAKTRIDHVEKYLGELNRQLHKAKNELSELIDYRNGIVELEKIQDQLLKLSKEHSNSSLEALEVLRNEIATECLKKLQIELAQKNAILTDAMMQNNIIADIERNIKFYEEQLSIADAVVEALSPTEGLIAEGLLGFIKSYVSKMNILISRIWTYRMEVQDCKDADSESAELDYKFPVIIQSDDNRIPDVSKCSTGQREIIDLSFKIVAMNYLGMSNFPLVLDELGSAMDPEHRFQVVHLINFLIEQCSFSQLFIVSHDYAQYGSLGNMQTCVICPNNIVVPDKYNEHVVIS